MKTLLILLLIFIGFRVLAQNPDTLSSPLRVWSFDKYPSPDAPVTADTIIDNIYDFMPFHKNYVSFLGNNGSATFPMSFTPPDENIPSLFKPWQVYFNEDRSYFYNTRKPYSNIKFVTGTSKDKGEQYIRILHTQNITPKLNISLKGLSHNAIGSYLHQENRSSCFRFSSNYTGEKYKLYAYYDLEKFKLSENGGIVHDDYITDSLYKPDNLSIHLGFGKNIIGFRNGFLHQQFTLIGKKDSIDSLHTTYKSILEIHHGGRYQWIKKIYEDQADTNFYKNNFLVDSTQTHDSLQSEHITQYVSLVLTENNPLKLGFLAGGLYDQQSYYHIHKDTLYNSYGFQVSVFKITDSVFNGSFIYENWISGYRKGNSKITGFLDYLIKHPRDTVKFALNASFISKNPEFFENSWASNNFIWNNNFSQQEYSSAFLTFYDKRFSVGFKTGINTVKNYIYFDTLGLPAQQGHTIKITSFELYKNFTWRHFHQNNKLLVQQSSNDSVLRIPSYIGIHSIYYQFLAFKKVLKVQLGAEVYFFTKYYAPRYIPATGSFALQNERKTGAYPFTDVFINLHLKRACLFFKLEHANYSLSPSTYFLAPHYPVAPRTLKFGVSWNFYD